MRLEVTSVARRVKKVNGLRDLDMYWPNPPVRAVAVECNGTSTQCQIGWWVGKNVSRTVLFNRTFIPRPGSGRIPTELGILVS